MSDVLVELQLDSGNGKLEVLLVEDSEAQAELVSEQLVSQSYRVTAVRRVDAAVRWLSDHRPGVILLDLNLPDSHGLDAVKRIAEACAGIPIIVLTNVVDEMVALNALRDGAQDYLFKRDVNERSLNRAIRYAVERRRIEQARRESEERYALAVAGANDGIWDWHISQKTAYFSQRWKEILQLRDSDLGNDIRAWFDRIHPEDLAGFRSAMAAHLTGKTGHFEFEHRLKCEDGEYVWVLSRGLTVCDDRARAYRIAGSLTDISDRKRTEAQLIHDALHDALTALPNRTLFMDRLKVAIRGARRTDAARFAVLFFDLDRFKNVNDSLGHAVGDELLVEVAGRLEKFLRPGDTLARLGGDEFAVLLPEVAVTEDATHVAERVQELLAESFRIREHELYVSASVGIALSTPHYERPEEMLRDADLAMYRAKSDGGKKYELFDNTMHETAIALHRLETDLRRALDADEFLIRYQPIVSLATQQVVGFEALLRWQHPQWGLVTPDYFIEVAEDTGLIVPIGWWALREACLQTRRWQQLFNTNPPLSVSVNISGKLFVHSDLPARLDAILKETGLPAQSLRLEITENTVMNHGDEAVAAMAALRSRGVQLHIDDFGTGYASLSYLQRFSYDSLKIDRSFVSGIELGEEGDAIVRAIVALGQSLGMRVIAEGVETQEQLERLKAMECPEAQGFLFSRPLSESDTVAYLNRCLEEQPQMAERDTGWQ